MSPQCPIARISASEEGHFFQVLQKNNLKVLYNEKEGVQEECEY
jgi:hypothetical protein